MVVSFQRRCLSHHPSLSTLLKHPQPTAVARPPAARPPHACCTYGTVPYMYVECVQWEPLDIRCVIGNPEVFFVKEFFLPPRVSSVRKDLMRVNRRRSHLSELDDHLGNRLINQKPRITVLEGDKDGIRWEEEDLFWIRWNGVEAGRGEKTVLEVEDMVKR